MTVLSDASGPGSRASTEPATQSPPSASIPIADLIKRLEAATGPDRAIEQAIFRTLDLTELQERHCREWCRMDGRTDLTRDRYLDAWAPSYTLSLDAALTLVPVGHRLNLLKCRRYNSEEWEAEIECPAPLGDGGWALGRSAALALCIAALKARNV